MDNYLFTGLNKTTQLEKSKMMSLFEFEELGKTKEYVGCKIESNWNKIWLKLTQPVMVQSFQEKLELYAHGKDPMTPDDTCKVLSKGRNKVTLSKEE